MMSKDFATGKVLFGILTTVLKCCQQKSVAAVNGRVVVPFWSLDTSHLLDRVLLGQIVWQARFFYFRMALSFLQPLNKVASARNI